MLLNTLLQSALEPGTFCGESASPGTVTYGASSAYGNWAQLIASADDDYVITRLSVSCGVSPTNTTITHMIQFGIGQSGSEIALNVEIPLVMRQFGLSTSAVATADLPAPLFLPRSQRLIVRGKRDQASSAGGHLVMVAGLRASTWLALMEQMETLGFEYELGMLGVDYDMSEISNPAVGALPTATSITAGSPADTFGAWTEIIANVPQDCWIPFVNSAWTSESSPGIVVDYEIGIGASGVETTIGTARCRGEGSSATLSHGSFILHAVQSPIFVPSGARLSARIKSRNASLVALTLIPVLKRRTGQQGTL